MGSLKRRGRTIIECTLKEEKKIQERYKLLLNNIEPKSIYLKILTFYSHSFLNNQTSFAISFCYIFQETTL